MGLNRKNYKIFLSKSNVNGELTLGPLILQKLLKLLQVHTMQIDFMSNLHMKRLILLYQGLQKRLLIILLELPFVPLNLLKRK
jgi:hypothetical protein